MATIAELELLYQQKLFERTRLVALYDAGDTAVITDIRIINQEIADTLFEIDRLRAQKLPVESTGETVALAAAARDDGSLVQDPPNTAPVTAQGRLVFTNANKFLPNTDVDVGTDGDLRPIVETQAVPPSTANYAIPDPESLPPPGSNVNSINEGSGENDGNGGNGGGSVAPPNSGDDYYTSDPWGSLPTPTRSITPGVGAADDDSARTNAFSSQSETASGGSGGNEISTLANKTAQAITPKPNILDQYSSYTYSVSIYLMSPEDYNRLLTSKKKYIPGYQLLMQSGGAPQFASGVNSLPDDIQEGGVSLAQGRNQFFPLDYYLDDLEIKSVIHGKGTGAAHNAVEMKFRIIEPNGITLLDNLYKAANQYVTAGGGGSKTIKNANYAAQNYLMIVRFYGYDENGNLKTAPASMDASGRTDSYAIVEKFIPFQFTSIKFRIANKLTEYSCEAVCPQYVIGTSQGRGVIPFNIELSATTLQNLFNGNVTWAESKKNQQTDRTQQSPNTAPDKATSAPDPVLNTGLTQALNKYQQELKNDGTYEVPDIYNIVISHPEIANASIIPPTITDLTTKPMTDAQTAAQALGGKQSVNTRAMTKSATAGMSIVQFIDMAVRSSNYVFKQQIKIIDKDGKEIAQGTGAQAFAWYRIGVEAKPYGGIDSKRNDNAYKITYEVAPYGINDIKSEYFPKGKFRGTQKRYAHWFTGENTSILNFEQDFNYLYYITINSRAKAQVASRGTADYREAEKRLFAPNSPESNQGLAGDSIEPSANAADYLYSPGDQSRVRMTIVGDPAWIEQGEVWSGVRSGRKSTNDGTDVYFDAFLNDGTINFDAREALFEVVFNKPADYNIETGVMQVNNVNNSTVAAQSYIYKAVNVTSNFRQGKFTQDLEGVLLIFPDSNVKTQTVAQSQGGVTTNQDTEALKSRDNQDQSAAETARLERQAQAGKDLTSNPTVVYTDPMGGDDAAAIMNAADSSQTITPPPTNNGPSSSSVDEGLVFDFNDGIVREA